MKDRIDLESKSRQTLAQILGGAALLVGLYFTSQTLRVVDCNRNGSGLQSAHFQDHIRVLVPFW
jgi:hypothetical protein